MASNTSNTLGSVAARIRTRDKKDYSPTKPPRGELGPMLQPFYGRNLRL